VLLAAAGLGFLFAGLFAVDRLWGGVIAFLILLAIGVWSREQIPLPPR